MLFTDDVDDGHLDACRALLSIEERGREHQLHFLGDRRTYVMTRALARRVLSRYADIPPAVWRFECNDYGRPEIAADQSSRAPLVFDVSHMSGMIALFVRSTLENGADVEQIGSVGSSLGLADRFFAPQGAAALRLEPAARRCDRFFEYWTLKESYIKARGAGLSIPLDQFAFTLSPDRTIGSRSTRASTTAQHAGGPGNSGRARTTCWRPVPSGAVAARC